MEHTLFGVERCALFFYMQRILETFLCGWVFVMRNVVSMVQKNIRRAGKVLGATEKWDPHPSTNLCYNIFKIWEEKVHL